MVEVMVAAGMMSIMMLIMMGMQENQVKANNYLEFQLKRTQLQNVLNGQFLNNPNNCACLFAGAAPFPATPATPGATLSGVYPNQIGRYNFITQGVCATATMPQPFVDNVGIDGLKATSIQLANIQNISGEYSGELLVNLQSTKVVAGPKELPPIRIPVSVMTTPNGANVDFVNCSARTASIVNSITTSTVVYSGWTNNVTIASCPANFVLTQCQVEVNSPDGSSMFYQNHLTYISTAMGVPTGCSSSMVDSQDTYRLVLLCLK